MHLVPSPFGRKAVKNEGGREGGIADLGGPSL